MTQQNKASWLFGIVLFLPLHSGLAQVVNASDVGVAKRKLSEARTALDNLKGTINTLDAVTRSLVAEARSFPVERLLVDADICFDDRAYDKSATLYREAVESPGFKGQPGYYRALFRLGESLFQLGNYVSARAYFEEACEPASGEFMAQSAARLFEICSATKDFSSCERKQVLIESLATPETLYAYGKYLFNRGAKEKAMEFFGKVQQGSPNFGRARYFMGVIAIGANNLDQALRYFSESASSTAKEESEVKSLALLAMARVNYQKGQFEEALKNVQQIPTSANCFLESQMDLAWIYLKTNKEDLAVQALDCVLMGTSAGPLALSAQALKGRILSRSEEAGDARRAYDDVTESLGPVVNDLDRLSNDPALMETFFTWVLQRDSKSFEATLPISLAAARWLEGDEGVSEVVKTLDDVAKEKTYVEEASQMAEKLLATLRSQDVVVSFPAIKDNYLKTKEIENRAVDLALSAAKTMEAVLMGRVEGQTFVQYQQAVSNRKKAQEGFARVPLDYQAMKKREEDTTEGLKAIETELFKVEATLETERKEVVAMEEWLSDARARRAEQLTEEKEKEFRGLLGEEKKHLQEIFESAKAVRKDLEQARIAMAGKSGLLEDDDRVRGDLWKALLEEASALKEVAKSEGGDLSLASQEAAGLIGECAQVAEQVRAVGSLLDRLAKEGASEFERVVAREKERLDNVLADLKKLEMDAILFSRNEGRMMVQAAASRIHDVLLEADLGLADMAWNKVHGLHERLKKISGEESKRLERLRAAEEMLKTSGGEAVEQKKQEGVSQ